MECAPSITFLCVASSTSNAGTIWPAVRVSILIAPPVVLSRRSAMKRKLSQAVTVLGHEACILSVRGAGAWACAALMKNRAANRLSACFIVPPPGDVLLPEAGRPGQARIVPRRERPVWRDAETLEHGDDLARVLRRMPGAALEQVVQRLEAVIGFHL